MVEVELARVKNEDDKFQSAVRIAVWLKGLQEGGPGRGDQFQSAVRIAVWLKPIIGPRKYRSWLVSIRRADRCLVEGEATERGRGGRQVSIRRADRCLVEA